MTGRYLLIRVLGKSRPSPKFDNLKEVQMAINIAPLTEHGFRESTDSKKSQSPKIIKLQQEKSKQQEERLTLPEIKDHLDEILKETKITYSVDEKDTGFIIKVMDKKTDKIIQEIPSKDIQVLRKHYKDHLGVLFNELI